MPTDSVHTFRLTGELSLRQAGDVLKALADTVSTNDRIDIDCADVSEIDISILQLLLAASRSAEAANKPFSVRFPVGGVLDNALGRAGFSEPDGRPKGSGPWKRYVA